MAKLLAHQHLPRQDKLVRKALTDELFRQDLDSRLHACGLKFLDNPYAGHVTLVLDRDMEQAVLGEQETWLSNTMNLDRSAIALLMVLWALIIIFFPSLFFDLARLGNDSLSALLFAGVFYFLLACIYQGINRRFLNLLWLSIMLGLGLLTKLFFLPIAAGAVAFYVWLGRRGDERLGWRVLSAHLAVCFAIVLLISGWWYVQSFHRYGMVFVSDEMMEFRYAKDALGLHLPLASFIGQLGQNFAGFCTSFIWSGTQSWIPRFPLSNLLWFPLFLLTIAGAYKSFRREKLEPSFWLACLFVFIPLVLGFLYHMYTRVKFTGVGSGTGGYYLFVVWPVIGCLATFCFENAKSSAGKFLLILAIGLVFAFEVSGWWFLMQIFSGVVEKAGSINRGVGAVSLTPANLRFAIENLKDLAFPWLANLFYIASIVVKGMLLWLAIFRYHDLQIKDQSTA